MHEFGIVNAENQITSVLWKNYTKSVDWFSAREVAFSLFFSLFLYIQN